MRWAKYLWRALNARPFGMPIPPLWFGIAAFALLGHFLNPAFYLIGAGVTALCMGLIASNRRFQNSVDAADLGPGEDPQIALLKRLDDDSRARQARLEQQCKELQRVLEGANAGHEHIQGVWQLAQLHLRLLAARSAADAVVSGRDGEAAKQLAVQAAVLKKRMAQPDLDQELREALDDHNKLLEKRLAVQGEARRRVQLVDAELDRIREQIALIREEALLTSDPAGIRRSVDSLAAFLNESGRWLQDQEEIFGGLDPLASDPFGPTSSDSTSPETQQRPRNGSRMGESQ